MARVTHMRIWNDGRMKIGGDSDHFLSVRFYYRLGAGGHSSHRGYYLSVTPVRSVEYCGVRMLEMCPWDGLTVMVGEPITRRSAKSDAAASDAAKLLLGDLVDRVCAKNGISRGDVGELID